MLKAVPGACGAPWDESATLAAVWVGGLAIKTHVGDGEGASDVGGGASRGSLCCRFTRSQLMVTRACVCCVSCA